MQRKWRKYKSRIRRCALACSIALSIFTSTEILQLIEYYSGLWNVDFGVMARLAQCESRYGDDYIGDNGKSVGVYQWHENGIWLGTPVGRELGLQGRYDIHSDIQMAMWAASQGLLSHWSCYRG